MCENDAYPALDMAGMNRVTYDPNVRVIPLRCLGSMNIVWIADALSRGIDGVMLMGCKYGEDYQCHFAKGSELANRRLENVKETLQRLQLEPERIEVSQIAIDQYDKLPGMINASWSESGSWGRIPTRVFSHGRNTSHRTRQRVHQGRDRFRRSRPEEVFSMCHLLFGLHALGRRVVFSPPADDRGAVGPERKSSERPRDLALPRLRRLHRELSPRCEAQRRDGRAPERSLTACVRFRGPVAIAGFLRSLFCGFGFLRCFPLSAAVTSELRYRSCSPFGSRLDLSRPFVFAELFPQNLLEPLFFQRRRRWSRSALRSGLRVS